MTHITLHNLSPLIEASALWSTDPTIQCWLMFEANSGRIRLSREQPSTDRHFADVSLVGELADNPAPLENPTVLVEWPSGRHKFVLPAAWDQSAPYTGRPYVLGKYDCYTLVRDWMRSKGINMDYLTDNQSRLLDEWLTDGAFESNSELSKWDRVINPQEGDGILFAMNPAGSARANHAGVYLGENQFLHHFPNRASTTSELTELWRSRVAAFMRHNG